jgi:RHS repeat-associated protein
MTTKYQPNSANPYAKIAHGTEVVEPEYDPQGNCPSLCSRPAKWLRFEDTAIAVKQWLHDATRKLTQAPPSEPSGYAQRDALSVSRLTSVARFTWDADIHLMSVTAQGSPQSSPHSPSEEPGTAGAAGRGATGSVVSGQARSLPYLSQYNAVDEAPSKTTTTLNTWGEDLSGSLQGAGGIGGLLRSVNTTANRELRTENTFHYDSNGNVILLTDTQGRESARYAYDAFGKTLTATGPAARGNRYRFSTKPVEVESGLVYYGYRYYDPVTGRWPSRDPIEEQGGVNVYGMVGNDVVSQTDLIGLVGPVLPAVFYVMAGAVVGCACAIGLNTMYDVGYSIGNGLCGSMVGCPGSSGVPRDFWDVIKDNITLKNCLTGAIPGTVGGPAATATCIAFGMPLYIAGGVAGCYDAWQGNPYNG